MPRLAATTMPPLSATAINIVAAPPHTAAAITAAIIATTLSRYEEHYEDHYAKGLHNARYEAYCYEGIS